MVKQDYLNLPF